MISRNCIQCRKSIELPVTESEIKEWQATRTNEGRCRMNGFELIRRAEKAERLADLLTSFGISSASARKLTGPQWKAAADAAGCKPPNSELTRQAVYAAMKLTASESQMTVAQWKNFVEGICPAITAS